MYWYQCSARKSIAILFTHSFTPCQRYTEDDGKEEDEKALSSNSWNKSSKLKTKTVAYDYSYHLSACFQQHKRKKITSIKIMSIFLAFDSFTFIADFIKWNNVSLYWFIYTSHELFYLFIVLMDFRCKVKFVSVSECTLIFCWFDNVRRRFWWITKQLWWITEWIVIFPFFCQSNEKKNPVRFRLKVIFCWCTAININTTCYFFSGSTARQRKMLMYCIIIRIKIHITLDGK